MIVKPSSWRDFYEKHSKYGELAPPNIWNSKRLMGNSHYQDLRGGFSVAIVSQE
jgi:hypothetical protein